MSEGVSGMAMRSQDGPGGAPVAPSTSLSSYQSGVTGYAGEVVGTDASPKPHRHGVMISSSGSVYEGEFKEGKKEGRGIFSYDNGNTFKGEFKDGFKDGFGCFLWSKGDAYEGHFLADRRTGHLPSFFPSFFSSLMEVFSLFRLWFFSLGEWELVLWGVEG